MVMKSSNYNIFFDYQDKMVGYNSLSDNFMVLEPTLYELFKSSIKDNKTEALAKIHKEFYDSLKTNGFIISSKKNELEEIKRISHETDFNEKNYTLVINPTMNCNFNCWYCYETHLKKSRMSKKTITKVCSLIDNIISEKKEKLENFAFSWFGGEPLLNFYNVTLPILEKTYPLIKEQGISCVSGFTSNGLLITQKLLDKCIRYSDHLHFQITLDGHRDRHNKVRYISKNKGSYDKIVENIKLNLKNGIATTVRFNISQETLADLPKIMEDFEDVNEKDREYLKFSFHKIWQVKENLNSEISSIVEIYRKAGFTCSYIGDRLNAIRQSCYADKPNQATINFNGDVFKCTAREFIKSKREGVLEDSGKITWNEKKLKDRLYNTKFKNKPCLSCKLLPICNGGCSQVRMENRKRDYCIFNFDNKRKLEIVKEKFYSRMV